jgi:hypothetical protein
MSWGDLLSFAGTAFGIYSSYQQGQSAKEQYEGQADYTEEVAKHNSEISLLDASVAEKDAIAVETAYGWKLRRHMRQVDQVLGKARAGYAKSGVVASSGSALDTMVDIARSGAEDAALIAAEGKTAYERGKDIAARYRKLAAAGLRDAAYQASMLESAGADAATYGTLSALSVATEGLYDYGDSQGWWD